MNGFPGPVKMRSQPAITEMTQGKKGKVALLAWLTEVLGTTLTVTFGEKIAAAGLSVDLVFWAVQGAVGVLGAWLFGISGQDWGKEHARIMVEGARDTEAMSAQRSGEIDALRERLKLRNDKYNTLKDEYRGLATRVEVLQEVTTDEAAAIIGDGPIIPKGKVQ